MTFVKRGAASAEKKLIRRRATRALKTEPREPKDTKPFLDGYKSPARRYGRDR